MTSPDLRWSARFDRSTCSPHGGRAHLIVEFEPAEPAASAERRPLDLVLVLDASGSMQGAKLAAVRAATARILERLRAEDRVTVVTFADDVVVHADHVAPRGPAGARLAEEMSTLQTRGSTNLSGGWLVGIELATARAEPGRRAALVLLSDGHANAGVVDPLALSRIARQAAGRGVCTTCVGVGADYSTTQLGPIAEASGGRFHHADTDGAIYRVLLGEVDELDTVVAEQVELGIGLPAGFGVEFLGSGVVRTGGGLCRIDVGPLYGGVKRALVVALDVPPRSAGSALELPVAVTGTEASSGEAFTLGQNVELCWGDPNLTPASADDVLLVVRQTAAWLERTVANLNEQGEFGQVTLLRKLHLPRLRRYAHGHPEALAAVDRLEASFGEAEEPMAPMLRKELYVSGLKFGRSERDLR